MKKVFCFVLILVVSTAHALEFSLDCDDDGKALPVKVVKVATKSGGKWANSYFVEISGKSGDPQRLTLESARNGDEDYNDYNVVGSDKSRYKIAGASIQNRFKWASLTNEDGYSFARCR